ncbi:MAG: ZIP family metal transporter [Vicinamibacterales bacterium]
MRRSQTPATVSVWVIALLPLALLAGLVSFIVWSGPAEAVRGDDYPPIEELTFQRVMLGDAGIIATVLNDGPDPVTIAQVQVDDAYWEFSADPGVELGHLDRAVLTIPYPWVQGDTHVVRILTSSGVTFDYEVAVAVQTPQPDGRYFAVFTLIGLYVGVLPVAIGLMWFPLVSRLGRAGLDFVLALTLGLMVFLLVEAGQEGLETAGVTPSSFQGVALFVCVAIGAFLALETLGRWLRGRRQRVREQSHGQGWVLAVLVAVGIGLHNFGEGLAIGAAFALGEAALGTVLIVGFTLHNTTEGLAIVSPLAKERVRIRDLVQLGLIGGAPTIAGAWIGGFVYSPIWSVVFLAVGAGAIAQVIVQIARQMAGDTPVSQHMATVPVLSGLMAGFGVMYVTGLVVG